MGSLQGVPKRPMSASEARLKAKQLRFERFGSEALQCRHRRVPAQLLRGAWLRDLRTVGAGWPLYPVGHWEGTTFRANQCFQ